ncbi:PEP-CTERM system TPR-repeat protein PrsT [Pacificimonas sp. WHA3]|uniref:PEP-CTERM system TPR-repeat protein PrsT n=1 Tax=Pacificimonas pallii TaxID=2827236 RepID=A0ABS6SFA3_9SPHN|nr:XrtA/PEP-CTERM system TPR-repeat protein PrsT [Pacificimonas pallii]MBV7256616.1 PEP-CTERM system TPR-repeat protein PrsT [Pacificimonas pallii]
MNNSRIVNRKTRLLRGAALAAAVGLLTPLAATPARADAESESNEAYTKAFESYYGGDFRTARIQLLNALKQNPENSLARILQARVALELGGGVQAQTELERAVASGVPGDKVRHLRAHAFLLQGKTDEARDLLQASTIPPQFEAYASRLRGLLAFRKRDFELAEREFNRALALAPEDPATVNAVAKFMGSIGQHGQAIELLDYVLERRPTHVKTLVVRGDMARNAKGLEAALPFFNRAVEIDPNNIEALLERAATLGDLRKEKEARADIKRVNQLVEKHPLALYLEAVLDTRNGQTDNARTLMTETRGVLDDFPPAVMLQGLLALDAGNIEQATDFLGKLVGMIPNSKTARKLYATAQLQKGDPEGAFASIKPILDANSADARTYAIAGAARARVGMMNEAQDYLQKAQEAGGEVAVQNQLAMTQLLQGQTDLAEETVATVLRDDETSLSAMMMQTLIDMRQGDFQDALRSASKIAKEHPQLPIGWNLRGGAYLGLGDRDKAEASFRAALKRKPDYPEARRNLAQLLIAKGDARGAKRQLRQVIANDGTDVRALLTLGELAGVEGDRKEQLEWLQQAAGINRGAPGPRIALTDAYMAAGNENAASNEANALLRDFPENPDALLTAARIYEQTGRQSQLVSLFDRMVSSAPDALLPRILLGRALQANDRVDDARSTFQRALTITGESTVPAYLELIALEARAGRMEQAREWAVRLRNERPDSNIAENALGRAYMISGKPQEALASFASARKKNFDLATARGIADAYVRLNRRDDAIKVLQSYQSANPKDSGALASIAELQLAQGQYRQAIANYEQLREVIGNRDPAILNNLAWAYIQLEDPRAIPVAKMAYNFASRNPSIADTYGWAMLKAGGDKKEALSLLRRASRALPRSAEIRYHLAEAYLANGKRAEALTEVQRALKSNQQFSERTQAQVLLRRLQGS